MTEPSPSADMVPVVREDRELLETWLKSPLVVSNSGPVATLPVFEAIERMVAAQASLSEKLNAARDALEVLLGSGKSGSWATCVEPLIARFDVAAQFGGDAVHNAEGSRALAELLRSMAAKLDRAVTCVGEVLATLKDTGQ